MSQDIQPLIDSLHDEIDYLNKMKAVSIRHAMIILAMAGYDINCPEFSIHPSPCGEKWKIKFNSPDEEQIFNTANDAINFLIKRNKERLKESLDKSLEEFDLCKKNNPE